MEQKQYKTLFEAVKDNEDDENHDYFDIVALPPDVVDELTDTEDNFPPRLSEVTDIENVPEVCGQVEVFYHSNNNFEIQNAFNTSAI